MRICWFGIYSPEFARNAVLLSGLLAQGATIVECRVPADDPNRHRNLIRKLRALRGQYDVIYVACPSPSVVPWAWLFGKGPVVVDAVYSMYDAVVNDRREAGKASLRALKLALLDWLSIVLADLVVTDTGAYTDYWKRWPFLSRARYVVIQLGADTELFAPRPKTVRPGAVRVLFYGTYIPLHGVQRIIEAAAILRDESQILFTLIGKGQKYAESMRQLESLRLSNVEVIGKHIPIEEIADHIAASDIVLGIFGGTARTSRGIPLKVYQALAMRKPVITTDTPAVREFFTDAEVMLVKGDAESIATAICALAEDPERRDALAARGYEAALRFTPERLAAMLMASLMPLVSGSKPPLTS